MSLKENLKKIRLEKGYTQKQLSEKMNISSRTYESYEHGRAKPTYEVLEKLTQILGCSYDDLLK